MPAPVERQPAPTLVEPVRVATAIVRLRGHRLVPMSLNTAPGGHIRLVGDRLLIGRGSDCDVVLTSESVSRNHALLVRRNDDFTVEDLDSSHGVFLNGLRIRSASLCDGDLLQLADLLFKYEEC